VKETLNKIIIVHHHITGDQVKAITHHQEALYILLSQQCKPQEMQPQQFLVLEIVTGRKRILCKLIKCGARHYSV